MASAALIVSLINVTMYGTIQPIQLRTFGSPPIPPPPCGAQTYPYETSLSLWNGVAPQLVCRTPELALTRFQGNTWTRPSPLPGVLGSNLRTAASTTDWWLLTSQGGSGTAGGGNGGSRSLIYNGQTLTPVLNTTSFTVQDIQSSQNNLYALASVNPSPSGGITLYQAGVAIVEATRGTLVWLSGTLRSSNYIQAFAPPLTSTGPMYTMTYGSPPYMLDVWNVNRTTALWSVSSQIQLQKYSPGMVQRIWTDGSTVWILTTLQLLAVDLNTRIETVIATNPTGLAFLSVVALPQPTPSATVTPTQLPSTSPSSSSSSSASATQTPQASVSSTPRLNSPSPQQSSSTLQSATVSQTSSLTPTSTITPSTTDTPSATPSPTPSPTSSLSYGSSPSVSPTSTPSTTQTPTPSPTPTATLTPSSSPTITPRATLVMSLSVTPTQLAFTPSAGLTPSPTLTPSQQPAPAAAQAQTGLTPGAQAGIGIGTVAGALAVGGIGFVLLKSQYPAIKRFFRPSGLPKTKPSPLTSQNRVEMLKTMDWSTGANPSASTSPSSVTVTVNPAKAVIEASSATVSDPNLQFQRFQDETGDVWFVNSATGESVWELPQGANVISLPGSSV